MTNTSKQPHPLGRVPTAERRSEEPRVERAERQELQRFPPGEQNERCPRTCPGARVVSTTNKAVAFVSKATSRPRALYFICAPAAAGPRAAPG